MKIKVKLLISELASLLKLIPQRLKTAFCYLPMWFLKVLGILYCHNKTLGAVYVITKRGFTAFKAENPRLGSPILFSLWPGPLCDNVADGII